jgi:hypothetical protein
METKNFRNLCIEKLAEILQYRIFTKETTTSSLREISSPFFLQEYWVFILLKTKDRFTSLMVIGMKKIMCNIWSLPTIPCFPHTLAPRIPGL